MPTDSDQEPMDVDETMNETQFSNASSGVPGTPSDENLTSIYAKHYEEAQRIHRKYHFRLSFLFNPSVVLTSFDSDMPYYLTL